MEATIFTGWIYDHLLPHAEQVKVAHPLVLRAIAAAKKKNDRIDAALWQRRAHVLRRSCGASFAETLWRHSAVPHATLLSEIAHSEICLPCSPAGRFCLPSELLSASR